jgi:hypothetical protein
VEDPSRFGDAQIILYEQPPEPVSVFVAPGSATVALDSTQGLAAIVVGSSNTAVTWSVTGGSANGTITGNTYTPPSALPSPATVTVRATSVADTTKYAEAQITLVAAGSQIQLYIDPVEAEVVASKTQLFTAILSGSTNTAVTWEVVGGSANGSITAQGLYTAPARPVPTTAVTVRATSVANPAKTAEATVTLVNHGTVGEFEWDKIVDKLNEMKSASPPELSEGDIAIVANNSVGLNRKYSISETKEDTYSSTIGNSWGYVKGNSWSLVNGNTESTVKGTADSTVEGKSTSYSNGGTFSRTMPYATSITLGPQLAIATPLALNVTAGIWANIVIPGFSVEAYFGGKVTFAAGRNFKFYDLDDFEVCEKTASLAAKNGVSLECGPPSTGAMDGALQDIQVLKWKLNQGPAATTTVNLLPKSVEHVVPDDGEITFKIGANVVLKMTKDEAVFNGVAFKVVAGGAKDVDLSGKQVLINGHPHQPAAAAPPPAPPRPAKPPPLKLPPPPPPLKVP